MQPILFNLGPLAVYSYGVFVVLGFVTAAAVVLALAGQAKLPRKRIADYVLVTALGGLLGARAWYLILRPDEAGGFWNWFAIGGGRLALAGGIVGGLAALLYMLRRSGGTGRGVSVWRWLDIAAVAALAGLAVGRIGSLLNGDYIGTATTLPWGVSNDDQLALLASDRTAHPLALYAALLYAVIALYGYRLWKLGAGKAKPGLTFWVVTFLLGVTQIALEVWHHSGEALEVGGFPAAAATGLVLIAVSLYFLVRRYRIGLAK